MLSKMSITKTHSLKQIFYYEKDCDVASWLWKSYLGTVFDNPYESHRKLNCKIFSRADF